jgi:hypothetical protein
MRTHIGKGPLQNLAANGLEYSAWLQHQKKQPEPLLPTRTQSTATGKPWLALGSTATIDSLWADHNVQSRGHRGMLIHAAFAVANLLNRPGRVAAHFYFSNWVPLQDINNDYRTATGQVSVSREFVADYERTRYKDFELFMPYRELHMGPGNHSLTFAVSIWDRGRRLAWAEGPPFTYRSR